MCGGAGSCCTVPVKAQQKKLCTAGFGEQSVFVDPWQEEGRVQGQVLERVNACIVVFHSGKQLCCYLLSYATCCLSSLLVTMPAGSPLALGSPLYLSSGFFVAVVSFSVVVNEINNNNNNH